MEIGTKLAIVAHLHVKYPEITFWTKKCSYQEIYFFFEKLPKLSKYFLLLCYQLSKTRVFIPLWNVEHVYERIIEHKW